MKFTLNPEYTIFAQNQDVRIDGVYTDDAGEFIVEKHRISNNPPFEFRLAIKRSDGEPCHSWSLFQEIKDLVAGENAVAIEVYPKRSEVTDTANIYHLWVFEEGYGPKVSLVPEVKNA